jgi:hypothetical protein
VSVSVQAFPSLQVLPLLFAKQLPSDPARLHAWHWSAHAVLQHTPPTQKPDVHWLFEEHASPKLAS